MDLDALLNQVSRVWNSNLLVASTDRFGEFKLGKPGGGWSTVLEKTTWPEWADCVEKLKNRFFGPIFGVGLIFQRMESFNTERLCRSIFWVTSKPLKKPSFSTPSAITRQWIFCSNPAIQIRSNTEADTGPRGPSFLPGGRLCGGCGRWCSRNDGALSGGLLSAPAVPVGRMCLRCQTSPGQERLPAAHSLLSLRGQLLNNKQPAKLCLQLHYFVHKFFLPHRLAWEAYLPLIRTNHGLYFLFIRVILIWSKAWSYKILAMSSEACEFSE